MKAIGLTCGIGSMLTGARQAGFEVEANIEWRKYYHTGTFQTNFPDAKMVENLDHMTPDEIERLMGVELALGHPECGNFSNLQTETSAKQKGKKQAKLQDPGDIPLFVDLIERLRPRFFVMDDLPKSFIAYPMSEYARRLPDYDLFPEWISNWGYGNIQKYRNRMFMIGALKEEAFTFQADERKHTVTTKECIEDLRSESGEVLGNFLNHHEHVRDVITGRAGGMKGTGTKCTWRDLAEILADKPDGFCNPLYYNRDGELKPRIGLSKCHWDKGGCNVLTGTNPIVHPLDAYPMSIRERARIQGFPDDFVFVGEILEDDLSWNHDRNNKLVKQTGKAMPVQFCRSVSEQIAAHIRGEEREVTGERVIRSNEYVDHAKQWYCENVGYSKHAQENACQACWLYESCTIRSRKFQIGEPVHGQRDLIDPGVVPSPAAPKPKRPKVKKARPPREPRLSRRFVEQTAAPTETIVFGGTNGEG